MADESLKKTPIYDVHVEWGAKMVEFAGWSMPVQYAGIVEEHVHTRTQASVFDVSHMGRLRIRGAKSEAFLNRLCTRKLLPEPGRCFYGHICQDDGGILDDVIVTCFEEEDWGVVCNASNRDKIAAWLANHQGEFEVILHDETSDTAMIAVQGPKTVELAESMVGADLTSIKRYRFKKFEMMGLSLYVYRTGYTGEDGFEVVLPAGIAKMLMPRLLGTPTDPHPLVKPAGLGARDTLRLEAGMPLYGHEMNEGIDSLTAGQAWAVDLSKDFIGVEPMRERNQNGLKRKIVGLELEGKRIARQHHEVFGAGGRIGEITSGTFSPTLGKSIAMALIDAACSEVGTEVEIELGRKRVAASVVALPFYKRPKK